MRIQLLRKVLLEIVDIHRHGGAAVVEIPVIQAGAVVDLGLFLDVVEQDVLDEDPFVFLQHILIGNTGLHPQDQNDAGLLHRGLKTVIRACFQFPLGKKDITELGILLCHKVAVIARQQLPGDFKRIHPLHGLRQAAVAVRIVDLVKIRVHKRGRDAHDQAEGLQDLGNGAVVNGQRLKFIVDHIDLGQQGILAVDRPGQHRIDNVHKGVVVRDGDQRQKQLIGKLQHRRGDGRDVPVLFDAQSGSLPPVERMKKRDEGIRIVSHHIAGGDDKFAAVEPLGSVRRIHHCYRRNAVLRSFAARKQRQPRKRRIC